jgi:hypothetical protein
MRHSQVTDANTVANLGFKVVTELRGVHGIVLEDGDGARSWLITSFGCPACCSPAPAWLDLASVKLFPRFPTPPLLAIVARRSPPHTCRQAVRGAAHAGAVPQAHKGRGGVPARPARGHVRGRRRLQTLCDAVFGAACAVRWRGGRGAAAGAGGAAGGAAGLRSRHEPAARRCASGDRREGGGRHCCRGQRHRRHCSRQRRRRRVGAWRIRYFQRALAGAFPHRAAGYRQERGRRHQPKRRRPPHRRARRSRARRQAGW